MAYKKTRETRVRSTPTDTAGKLKVRHLNTYPERNSESRLFLKFKENFGPNYIIIIVIILIPTHNNKPVKYLSISFNRFF